MTTDYDLWQHGVARTSAEFLSLPATVRAAVRDHAEAIRELKSELQLIAEKGDASTACAGCGGLCCDAGKYHFTVVDLLVYLVDNVELFVPEFAPGKACPYFRGGACVMTAPYRPFNCITFLCELVEERIDLSGRSRFHVLTEMLRGHYSRMEELFAGRFMYGLLMNSERHLTGGNSHILCQRDKPEMILPVFGGE